MAGAIDTPDIQTILLFATASAVLLVVPGPTIALVMARSISEGRRIAVPLVLGVGLGDFVAATLSLLGAGAILAASALAFTILKWVGGLYLDWLGFRLMRAAPVMPTTDARPDALSATSAFRDGFLVTVFNPKGILFFVAFVPQFIDPSGNYSAQAAFFVATFTLLGMLNGFAYAFGADLLRRFIRRAEVLRWMNRAGGGVIAAAGVAAISTRRPAG